GNPGPKGDTGAGGVSGQVIVFSDDMSVDPGAATGNTVPCPAGKVVTGGGVDNNGLTILASIPSEVPQGWHAEVYNEGSSAGFYSIWAVCVDSV
ncbi:hypothetical protein, partial [Streptomyces sp. NPDC004685]